MLTDDFKSRFIKILYGLFDALRQSGRMDSEVIPVFLVILRNVPNARNVYMSHRTDNDNSMAYGALYRVACDQNEALMHAFSSFESSFNDKGRGIDLLGTLIHNLEPFNVSGLTDEEFNYCFETSLEYSEKAHQGFSYGLPKELAVLLTQAYSFDHPIKVYNPFAGYCTVINHLPQDAYFFGEEINTRICALGVINLFAHRRLNNSYLLQTDSLRSNSLSNFDLCISSPPLGLKVTSGSYTSYVNHESAIIAKIIEDFSDEKKAVFLVSPNFLTSEYSQNKALRKELVDRNLLEFIVLLPQKLLSHTSIPLVAIFLNSSQRNHCTTFIDASLLILNKDRKDNILDVANLLNLLKSGASSKKRVVDLHSIRREEYNLSVKRYIYTLSDLTEDLPLANLSTVAEERLRIPLKGSAHAPFIKIKDLKSSALEGFLNSGSISNDHIPPQAYEVRYASLLLALRYNSLKPTALNFTDNKSLVFVSNDILTLKIDEAKIDIQYLIIELNSEFVQRQVESYSYGATIVSIKRKDVLNLKIRLPDKDTQKKIVHEKFQEFYLQKDKELQEFKKQFDIKDDTFQAVASLKHSLGRPMLNIGSAVLNLEALIKNSTDDKLKDLSVKTINAIRQNLQLTNTILEQNEVELNLSKYKVEEIELFDFISNYVTEPAEYSYTTTSGVSLEIIQNLNNKIYVNANRDLLRILFNDIRDNAERHAFLGEKKDGNKLNIKMEVLPNKNPPSVLLSFSNNGQPFPENFDQEKFIRKNSKAGSTGNTGLGGYDINRIVAYLGGTFTLDLAEEEDFPTTYEIELPLLNTQENDDEEV